GPAHRATALPARIHSRGCHRILCGPMVAAARAHWSHDLCRPSCLAAIALLALNDHWLKGAGLLPAWVTGKLSDVAGLFALPSLCLALAGAGCMLLRGRALPDSVHNWLRAIVVTAGGATFAAVKLSPALNELVSGWCGPIALDATDLGALPALVLGGCLTAQR